METQIQKVISRISKEMKEIHERVPAARRYSKKLKHLIVGLLSSGSSRSDVSKMTGLSMTTLANWLKSDNRHNSDDGNFKEISVIKGESHNMPGFTIETPSGYKIYINNASEVPYILKAIEPY